MPKKHKKPSTFAPICHRGFWLNGIENSITSYKRAIELNLAIELDVFSSLDGVLYCFHDDNLKRMTGVDGLIYQKSSADLDKLRLQNSNEKIPRLTEVLSLVKDKVPLLIEIKNQPDKNIVEKVLTACKNFGCDFYIQSFNPLYLIKLKRLDKSVKRGILTTKDGEHLKGQSFINRLVIKNMLLNFLVKPHFISVHYKDLQKYNGALKKHPVLCWTVTNTADYKNLAPKVNGIIFENFNPLA